MAAGRCSVCHLRLVVCFSATRLRLTREAIPAVGLSAPCQSPGLRALDRYSAGMWSSLAAHPVAKLVAATSHAGGAHHRTDWKKRGPVGVVKGKPYTKTTAQAKASEGTSSLSPMGASASAARRARRPTGVWLGAKATMGAHRLQPQRGGLVADTCWCIMYSPQPERGTGRKETAIRNNADERKERKSGSEETEPLSCVRRQDNTHTMTTRPDAEAGRGCRGKRA